MGLASEFNSRAETQRRRAKPDDSDLGFRHSLGVWVLGYFVILPAWVVDGFSTTNLTNSTNFLGLMPAALDRIYRINRIFLGLIIRI